MSDRHKTPKLGVRLSAAELSALRSYATASGRPLNAVVRDAVRLYLELTEGDGQAIAASRRASLAQP